MNYNNGLYLKQEKQNIEENKIKILRKNEGLSQETLANMLKINRNYLSRIETGKSEPTSSILKNVALIFNVDLNDILEIKNTDTNFNKIKYISDNCKYLQEKDLDLIIRLIDIICKSYNEKKFKVK